VTPVRRAIVGIVGNDVPRQLVLASGGLPRRITGSWTGAIDADAQDLLGAADAVVARMLTELRSGHVECDALIVCADTQAHVRLFYVLRSIASELPLHLLDLPRAESAAARRFARSQLERLAAFLTRIGGETIDGAALAAAGPAERDLGEALARLRVRRGATPPECEGSAALDAWLEAGRIDPEEAIARVDEARVDVPLTAARVHITGSNHPDPALYRILEEQGCVVVGEDHDTGEGAWLGVAVDATSLDEAIERLVDLHFGRVGGSATASSADRARLTHEAALRSRADVVAGVIRDLDEAPAWDLSDQAAALAGIRVPFVMQTRLRPGDEARAARDLGHRIVERTASS
jgi:benzoyl-CoA reductase/2-hydroxyglutaryl-CoA dehydratase subunit BcrC/BadD/HgdB